MSLVISEDIVKASGLGSISIWPKRGIYKSCSPFPRREGGCRRLGLFAKLRCSRGLSEQELIIELVLLLFQQEKISLGKAAELLNLWQVRFQKILSERGINIHCDVEELQEYIH